MGKIAGFAIVFIILACNGKAKYDLGKETNVKSNPQIVTCDERLKRLILSCSNLKNPFNEKKMHAEIVEEVENGDYLIRMFEYGTGVQSTSTQGWLKLNVNKKSLKDVTLDPDNPEVLKFNAQLFNDYVEHCLEKADVQQDCQKAFKTALAKSNETLPYDKRIDIKTVEYNLIEGKHLKGASEYICDQGDKLRYVPLPNKGDVSLILVPMDCGDFDYRFYLLTIKNDAIISSLYVEGIWYEPDNDDSKEVTFFRIDKDFSVKVNTTSSGSIQKTKNYMIRDDGEIIEEQ